jgi:thiamine biosynthesis protein ThiS
MKFFVNDHCFEIFSSFTLLDLINYLNLKDKPIAVERNHLFIEKEKWLETIIQHSDTIEIVTIVGGG